MHYSTFEMVMIFLYPFPPALSPLDATLEIQLYAYLVHFFNTLLYYTFPPHSCPDKIASVAVNQLACGFSSAI